MYLQYSKNLETNIAQQVQELNNIYELLISEADAFSKFITTKNESHIHVYESSRLKAWDKIAQLLELEN